MKNTDGALLQNDRDYGFSTTGAHRGETDIWGSWKPPTKSVGGVPVFWFVTHCMRALGWGEWTDVIGCEGEVGDSDLERYLKGYSHLNAAVNLKQVRYHTPGPKQRASETKAALRGSSAIEILAAGSHFDMLCNILASHGSFVSSRVGWPE